MLARSLACSPQRHTVLFCYCRRCAFLRETLRISLQASPQHTPKQPNNTIKNKKILLFFILHFFLHTHQENLFSLKLRFRRRDESKSRRGYEMYPRAWVQFNERRNLKAHSFTFSCSSLRLSSNCLRHKNSSNKFIFYYLLKIMSVIARQSRRAGIRVSSGKTWILETWEA